jgi:hypothetical protein
MNETHKTDKAVWRRLRAGWPRSRTAPSENFVQSVMERVQREPRPGSVGVWAALRRAFSTGPARWSLVAAGALALGLLFLRPPVAPANGVTGFTGDSTLPWEDESSAGYGTDVEEYLL